MNTRETQSQTASAQPDNVPTVEIIVKGGVASVEYVPPGIAVRITDKDSNPPEIDTWEGEMPLSEEKSTHKLGVKFLKKGVKDSTGKYYPCWYSLGALVNGYARSILKGLPAELRPENNSDMTTDYFENDRVRFLKGTPAP